MRSQWGASTEDRMVSVSSHCAPATLIDLADNEMKARQFRTTLCTTTLPRSTVACSAIAKTEVRGIVSNALRVTLVDAVGLISAF
jgi:hypothetical protein